MNNLIAKLSVACGTSLIVTEAVSLEPLYNALITLAISIVSVLTIDGINWLRTKLRKEIKRIVAQVTKEAEEKPARIVDIDVVPENELPYEDMNVDDIQLDL